jgi:hypothetical protein
MVHGLPQECATRRGVRARSLRSAAFVRGNPCKVARRGPEIELAIMRSRWFGYRRDSFENP